MKKIPKPLPGNIVVEDIMHHFCKIYDNSDSASIMFGLRNDDKANYNGFEWLNRQNLLVGSESIPGKGREDYKGNIVVIDLHGNLLERLYEARKGEIAGLPYPSRNDKYLLFITDSVGDFAKNPVEGLGRMNSIMVMDLQKKQVISVFKDVGIIPAFEIHESPWLIDECRFVYSYTRPEGHEHDNTLSSSGIYICDIGNGQRRMLIPDAYFAICSPTNLKIAYIKDHTLRLTDLLTNKETVVYQGAKSERFRDIHWTPDGKCIYLAYFQDYPFGMFLFKEKLLDIATAESIPFKKVDFGLYTYSWK